MDFWEKKKLHIPWLQQRDIWSIIYSPKLPRRPSEAATAPDIVPLPSFFPFSVLLSPDLLVFPESTLTNVMHRYFISGSAFGKTQTKTDTLYHLMQN